MALSCAGCSSGRRVYVAGHRGMVGGVLLRRLEREGCLVFLMERYSGEQHVNVGCGEDLSITDLARLVADVVGFPGEFRYATDKPDGMPRKLLDVSKLTELGWSPRTPLRDGIADAYRWFLDNVAPTVERRVTIAGDA